MGDQEPAEEQPLKYLYQIEIQSTDNLPLRHLCTTTQFERQLQVSLNEVGAHARAMCLEVRKVRLADMGLSPIAKRQYQEDFKKPVEVKVSAMLWGIKFKKAECVSYYSRTASKVNFYRPIGVPRKSTLRRITGAQLIRRLEASNFPLGRKACFEISPYVTA